MNKSHKDEKWVFYKDIETKVAAPGAIRKVLAYCDNAMCVEVEAEKGAVVPMHDHPHTQISFITEGRFRFTIGDEEKEVSKGDSLCMQDGVKHGCVCLEKGKVVDFFTPMREDFVSKEP